MMTRPLPIRGLPLAAPPAPGLQVMEDVIHATSSHPRRPIAPSPLSPSSASPAPAPPSAASATASRPRWPGHGEHREHRPPQHPRRLQAAPSPSAATATAAARTSKNPHAHPHPPAHANASAVVAHASANAGHLFPARRYRKSIPELVPIRPEAFDSHHHPLTIRTACDVVRFFPFAVSASATLAGLSGLLAGVIANRVLGGDTPPACFMAVYLVLFLLNLLTHCFAAKGKLYFHNRRRFLHLIAANALLFLPHFIAYSILAGVEGK